MKEDYTFAFLEEAAPYLSATFLAQKVEQAVSKLAVFIRVEDIAPFLEKQDLGRILQKRSWQRQRIRSNGCQSLKT